MGVLEVDRERSIQAAPIFGEPLPIRG